MKHFINLKDIPALDLRKIILDAIDLNNDQEVNEWKLPYSAPLNYS